MHHLPKRERTVLIDRLRFECLLDRLGHLNVFVTVEADENSLPLADLSTTPTLRHVRQLPLADFNVVGREKTPLVCLVEERGEPLLLFRRRDLRHLWGWLLRCFRLRLLRCAVGAL